MGEVGREGREGKREGKRAERKKRERERGKGEKEEGEIRTDHIFKSLIIKVHTVCSSN